MCKSSSHALAPTASSRRCSASSSAAASAATPSSSSSSSSGPHRQATTTASPSSSKPSLSRLAAARASLPSPPLLYSFQELAAATNGFLSKRDSSSTYWRCSLRGRDAALFQLSAVPGLTPADASAALARTARYHHASLAPLLGACVAGPHVYLAYRLPPAAATLAACLLRSCSGTSKDLNLVGSWLSRVKVAADIAQGIDYAHTHADAVHGRLSPSTVLLVPCLGLHGLRATLTHFGANQLAQSPDAAAAQSDVRAFGVLLLQLLSGEAEASRYRFDSTTKEFARVTVLDTAADALRTGRVRTWVDRRLGDTFPVPAAEKLVEVALRCALPAEERPAPGMAWVAGKVSKVYVESRAWEHQLQHRYGCSVSLAPR